MKTLEQAIKEDDIRRSNGAWIPACGGTEKPFTARNGRRLQYMFQPSSGKHAYYDLDQDMFLSDSELKSAGLA